MPEEFFAIVVDVIRPEPTCLVDIPFVAAFNSVFRSIQSAANGAGLRPVRLDLGRKGGRFTEQIFTQTRSARLIVAVCTPVGDGPNAVPNPNVMFELGLALAIGKPVLILTTDADTLPADIHDISVLVYREEEPRTDEDAFASKIEVEMRRILDSLENELTNPLFKDIWVARAQHRMLLSPEFWRSFGVVFTYANRVRNEVESVYRDFTHDIARHAKEIVDRADERAGLAQFRGTWTQYTAHYDQVTGERLRAPAELRAALRRMDELSRLPEAKEQVARIDRYSGLVERRAARFHEIHKKTARACAAFFDEVSSEDLRAEFNMEVSEFVDAVKGLIDYSSGLVDNLVDMVAGGFEGPGARPVLSKTVRQTG